MKLRVRVGVLFIALLIAGCRQERQPYFGPTLTLDALVSGINANNQQIPTLWARQDFQGTLVDSDHQSHAASARGVLLYRAPDELRIVANDDFGQPAFEIGATGEFFWLKVIPGSDTLWWGRMKNAGDPRCQPMPVRPDLILDVLAIGAIDTDLSSEPYPVLRFDNDDDAYIVDSIVRQPSRLIIRKEVWYDRATLLPSKVILYDDNGRAVLIALVGDFDRLGGAAAAPLLPTRYDLFFPDTGSKMQFVLRDEMLTKNGIPHPGSIHLPDLTRSGVKTVVQIDKDCGP
jgi:hypothetical protein